MKLPGVQYRGVQSQGRLPVGGVLSVANAWSSTLTGTGQMMTKIAEAEAKQDAAQRIAQDQRLLKEATDWLITHPTVDIADPNTPEWVRKTVMDKASGPPEQYTPTQDVMNDALRSYATELNNASAQELGGYGKKLYATEMSSTWANTASTTNKQSFVWRREKLKADADATFQEYVNGLDEQGAMEFAEDSVNSGAWSASDYQKAVEGLGNDIDTVRISQQMYAAETEADYDAIEQELLTGGLRLETDDRIALLKRNDSRRRDIDKQKEDWQERNFSAGMVGYLNGTLTKEQVASLLSNDRVNPTQGRTLITLVESGRTTDITDPGVEDSITRQIALTGNLGLDETVSENAARLKRDIDIAMTGVDPVTGEIVGEPTISGEDGLRLKNQVDTQVDKITRDTPYKSAKESIRTITGVQDQYGRIVGTGPNKEAYDDFTYALDAYMDREGADADPREWVRDNAARYSGAIYRAKGFDRVRLQYPSLDMNKFVREVTVQDEMGGSKVERQPDIKAIAHEIFVANPDRYSDLDRQDIADQLGIEP